MNLNKLKKINVKSIYDSDGKKVIDIDGKKYFDETSKLIILPYYVDKRGILLRYNKLPEFEIKQKGISHYLNALKCDTTEDKIQSAKDALLKYFGIKVYNDDKINIMNPIFLTDGQSTKYYFVFVDLYDGHYEEVVDNQYDSLEMKDKNAFISLNELDNCVIYDLVTNYSITQFKNNYILI